MTPRRARRSREGGNSQHDRLALIVLVGGIVVLVGGVILALLGMRVGRAEGTVTPKDLALAQAALRTEKEIVATGEDAVNAYLQAVEHLAVQIAQLDTLSAEENAKGEEVAAAFGADQSTFNRLIEERNSLLSNIITVAQQVQDSAAAVDAAYAELTKLSEIAKRASGPRKTP